MPSITPSYSSSENAARRLPDLPFDDKTGTCIGIIHLCSIASLNTKLSAALWVFNVEEAGVLPNCSIRHLSNFLMASWSIEVTYVLSK